MLIVLLVCYSSIVLGINTTSKRHVTSNNYNPPSNLPEIIINRSVGPYNYPVPNPPPQNFDEPPLNDYGPPFNNEPSYLPPLFDPVSTITPDLSGQYLPPPNNIQFRVTNMSCLDTVARKFFHVNFRTLHGYDESPIIENSKRDCITNSGDGFYIDANGNDMGECGIRYCNSNDRNLCVQVRIPTVRGLRLPEDPLIILQCKPQETIASRTKLLKLLPQEM